MNPIQGTDGRNASSHGARLGTPFGCALLLLLGCGASLGLPDTEATVTGTIESVSQPLPVPSGSEFGPTSVDVDVDDGAPCAVEVLATNDTIIVLTFPDGHREAGSFTDLVVGQRIHAWTVEPLPMECPRQVTAEVIRIDVATFGGV